MANFYDRIEKYFERDDHTVFLRSMLFIVVLLVPLLAWVILHSVGQPVSQAATLAPKMPPCYFTPSDAGIAVIPPPQRGYGDVNSNGYVDTNDYGLIITSGPSLTGDNKKAADVDNNGVLTFNDAVTINKYLQNVIKTFPVCSVAIYPSPLPTSNPIGWKVPPCYFPTNTTLGKRGYGDVNNNMYVDNEDSGMIINSGASLTGDNKKAADVDANGVVTFIDAVEIQKYLQGSITTFSKVCKAGASPTPSPVGTFPPKADIKANGSDGSITVAYNSSVTISWTSTYADTCNVSPGGWTGLSGSQPTGPLTNSSYTYILNCSGAGGSASDSVQITVSPSY